MNVCSSYSVIPTDDTHEDLIDVQDDGEDNLDEDEDEDEDVIDFKGLANTQPLWVLPLYSLLPGHKQAKVNAGQRMLHFLVRAIINKSNIRERD